MFGYYNPYFAMFEGSTIYREDGSIDRSGFAEKSQAAMDREDSAKRLLDAWIASSSKLPESDFPLKNESLVPPKVHLTQACYSDFRKYAIAKGVQVGRRVATDEERKATGDKRKGKLYMVWGQLPVPPKDAVAFMKNKKAKAAEAKAKKRAKDDQENQENGKAPTKKTVSTKKAKKAASASKKAAIES